MASLPAGPLEPGTRIDERYEIVTLLGAGGYGAVYRARQLNMDRDVAVKVIRPHLTGDDRVVKRFLREAKAVSRLKNPHIVPVYDFGSMQDGTLYLVMELLDGRTLKQILAEEKHLEPTRLARLLSQVCEALSEAHGFMPQDTGRPAPIVHRDLKPENIIVSRTRAGSEHCYLLDFGIARLEGDEAELDVSLTAGMALGTPHYMSPEQGYGDKPTIQADLWALGVIMYQGLSGKMPFVGATAHAIVAAVTRDPPAPLQPPPGAPPLPLELVELVGALLQKEPKRRPANAVAVQQILQTFVTTGTPHTPVAPMARVARPPEIDADGLGRTLPLPAMGKARRTTWPWLLAGLTALLAGGAIWRQGSGPAVQPIKVTPEPVRTASVAVPPPAPAIGQTPAPVPVALPPAAEPTPSDPQPAPAAAPTFHKAATARVRPAAKPARPQVNLD